MDTPVIVSTIAMIGSVAAALVSSYQSRRVAKLGATTQLELERMKLDRERRNKAFDAAAAEVQPIEAALSTAWEMLQQTKEVIGRVLSRDGDLEACALELQALSRSLSQEYASVGARLPASAQRAWHGAKKAVGTAASLVASSGAASGKASILHPVQEIRNHLTDVQAILASERVNVRIAAAHRALALL
jgi:hypothetical protein